ncbi:MAG: HK97-gp10 family putative phage morphogenesis protein [Pseudomonadota bacterium]
MTRISQQFSQKLRRRLSEVTAQIAEDVRAEAAEIVLSQRNRDLPLPSRLADSLEVVSASGDQKGREGHDVKTALPYAKYVEFGTRRMRAEPFLSSAARRIAARYPGVGGRP